MSNIKVNTRFDGGSIDVVNLNNPQNLQFKIRKDTNSHFAQWFYFQLNNVKGQHLKLRIDDLKNSAYPGGWENYNVCVSYDNQYWFRLASHFDGDNLDFSLIAESNSVYFAYFEPYSYQRHLELIGYSNQSSLVTHHILGETAEKRNLDLLIVGNIEAKHKIWITARQHPGETMAEWFMEGLIHKLLDEEDALSRTLLTDCVFYLVPNMNPDGACNGNLRVNTKGVNLNREWLTPSIEKSPEVYFVRQKMQETGVTMSFDIHGDENLPYVFTAGCFDNPSFSSKQKALEDLFQHYFQLVNPDYQTIYGYEKGHYNKEMATIGTNWVGNEFDCLALTIEMPFKDNANLPDKIHGWDGRRSYLLGQSLLCAINLVLRTHN